MKKDVNLLVLFLKFFKIGLFTFGGGYAMIPLIEKEVVNNKWIDKKDIVDIVAISQSIPGAVAVNMSLFVGYRISKKVGAIVSVLGCITPSFLIIILIATIFNRFQNEEIVQHAFTGILCSVVALIIISAIKMAKLAIYDFITFIITVSSILLLLLTNIHPILFILSGALTGIVLYLLFPLKAYKLVNKEVNKK